MNRHFNQVIAADLKRFGGTIRDLRLALWIANAALAQTPDVVAANDNVPSP